MACKKLLQFRFDYNCITAAAMEAVQHTLYLLLLLYITMYAFRMVQTGRTTLAKMDVDYMRQYNRFKRIVDTEIMPSLHVKKCPRLLRRTENAINRTSLSGRWYLNALTPPFYHRRRDSSCMDADIPDFVMDSDNKTFVLEYTCTNHTIGNYMNIRISTRTKNAHQKVLNKAMEFLRRNNISSKVMIRVKPNRALCTNYLRAGTKYIVVNGTKLKQKDTMKYEH